MGLSLDCFRRVTLGELICRTGLDLRIQANALIEHAIGYLVLGPAPAHPNSIQSGFGWGRFGATSI